MQCIVCISVIIVTSLQGQLVVWGGGIKGEDHGGGATWCKDVDTTRLNVKDSEQCLDVTCTHFSTSYDPNITTSEGYDPKTLSPKSGRLVRPTETVTLRSQKVGRSGTFEHFVPLILLVPPVCDTAPPIRPRFSRFSPRTLSSRRFFINSHCSKFSHPTEVYEPMDQFAVCPNLT
jgi:hypothetical protein